MIDKKCKFEYCPEQNRKYFILADGRIELQTKGDGSTARIMTQKEQHPVNCLVLDDYMKTIANDMHLDIEAYVDYEVGVYQQKIADLKSCLEEVLIDLRTVESDHGYDFDSKWEAEEILK